MNLAYLERIGLGQFGDPSPGTSPAIDAAAAPAPQVTPAPQAPAPQAPARPSSCAVVPKGTPWSADSGLSVLSYNLLAPAFVRPIDKRTGAVQPYAAFEWAEPAAEVLDWDVRRPRLFAELQASGADIICLQEVQFESDDAGVFVLPEWLRLDGYGVRLPGQTYLAQMADRNLRVLGERVAIGCAVLYREDRLESVGEPINSPNTLVAGCFRGRKGTPLEALQPTAVFSVHLDAQAEEKRIDQLSRCIASVRQVGFRDAIFAGDMNTEVLEGSCVAAILEGSTEPSPEAMVRECGNALRCGSAGEGDDDEDDAAACEARAAEAAATGPTEAQLQAWRELWQRAAETTRKQRVALARVPTGPTRSAYDHGRTCGPCVQWRLDHIFFTPRTLELRKRWATLEADPEGLAAGLPNRKSPSDHYPVAASFGVSAGPRLSAGDEAELLSRLDELDARQASEREALQRECDVAEPSPPPPAVEDGEADQGKKGKQKKKAEKPSPEMIAAIQERRKRTREQKEVHGRERAAFAESLGELELDALERRMALPVWVDTGSRT